MRGCWFFTFGVDHPLRHYVIAVPADSHEDAREKMVAIFGMRWAFQYESEEDAGVERFGYTVILMEEDRGR